jgi:hypothetical protein
VPDGGQGHGRQRCLLCCGSRSCRWALDTVQACLEAAWPAELLQHELGGELFKVAQHTYICIDIVTVLIR